MTFTLAVTIHRLTQIINILLPIVILVINFHYVKILSILYIFTVNKGVICYKLLALKAVTPRFLQLTKNIVNYVK